MHEPGTAIQTSTCPHPWVGANQNTLATLACGDSITGYSWSDYAKSFVHFFGDMGAAAGKLFRGCSVVAARGFGARHASSFMPFNLRHTADMIVGKVIG
jgi:hypothetical protein